MAGGRLKQIGVQVIRGISPSSNESPRGYLRRIAAFWIYNDPNNLLKLAKLTDGHIDVEDCAQQLSHAPLITKDEWRQIAYIREHGSGMVRFSGQNIKFGHLTVANPRICVQCFKEDGIENRLWELSSFVCCPKHGYLLVNSCSECGNLIPRRRADVCLCSCGFDIRNSAPLHAEQELLVVSSLIEKLSSQCDSPIPDLSAVGFPNELLHLGLDSFLQLIGFLGRFVIEGPKTPKRYRTARSGHSDSVRFVTAAACMLADWPNRFLAYLNGIIWELPEDKHRVSLLSVFGRFYQRLFGQFEDQQFSFLHRAFERSVLDNWRGPVQADQKWLTPASLEEYGWCTAEAARSNDHIGNPEQLVTQGYLDGFFVRAVDESRRRKVCWIRKDSIEDWKRERSGLIGLRDLADLLGLSWKTVFNLAKAGVFPKAAGPQKQHMYARKDALSLLEAFERSDPPEWKEWDCSNFITFHEALKTTLSHSRRLVAAVNAILDGKIVPVARTPLYPSLRGYLFKTRELLVIRHLVGATNDNAYLNASDVARMDLMSREKVLALIRAGMLSSREQVIDGTKQVFVPVPELDSFCARFVSTESLARRLSVSTKALVDRLRMQGTEFLAVPLRRPELRALFVPKAVADTITTANLHSTSRPPSARL